jgi:hypothetical protein
VYRNEVLRLAKIDVLNFWNGLPAQAQATTSFFSAEVAFMKLDALRVEENMPVLGITASNMPDQDWIIKVLRFIDRRNVSSCFGAVAPGAAALGPNEAILSRRLAYAQSIAKQRIYMLNGANLLATNKLIHDKAQVVWETKRKLLSQNAFIARLGINQGQAVTERDALAAKLRITLTEISLALYAHREPDRYLAHNPLTTPEGGQRARQYERAYSMIK